MRGSKMGGQNMPRTHPPPGKLKQPSDPPPPEKNFMDLRMYMDQDCSEI